MKQKISLFYVAIAFSIAGLCTSCSSDDPVDDRFYEFKMKQFLLALALGMRPAKIYNGKGESVVFS